MKQDVLILGGGISGLYLGIELLKQNREVLLLEKSSRLGGRIYTIKHKNHTIESGAGRFSECHQMLFKLLQRYNLFDKKYPITKYADVLLSNKTKYSTNVEDYYKIMGFDIMDNYHNCSKFFNPKILIIHHDKNMVGVARYIENNDSNLFLNLSYKNGYDKLSLGTNLFYILSDVTKKQNKKYLYVYETYKDAFSYKQKLPNVEIWNGREWCSE